MDLERSRAFNQIFGSLMASITDSKSKPVQLFVILSLPPISTNKIANLTSDHMAGIYWYPA